MFRGFLLILLSLLDSTPAHARSHCMDGLANFFLTHSSYDAPLNPISRSRRRKVYLGGFVDASDSYRRVWLVEETSPFAPGYVSKKMFRYVDGSPPAFKIQVPVPMTFQSGFQLVQPLTEFVDENERSRRRWGTATFEAVAEVGPRYFPDSVYFWIEQENDHDVVAAARLIHAPYPFFAPSRPKFIGPTADLYGAFTTPRDPYALNFDPDASIVNVAPPSNVPVEHILGVKLQRGAGRRVFSEAGCYSVDKFIGNNLQALAVHEMSLQITREIHRFSWMGYDFMNGASQIVTWADPQSLEIYSHWQGAQPLFDYMVVGPHQVDEQGRIVFDNRPWRLIKWDARDLLRENVLILDQQHVKFDSQQSRDRRIALFDPTSGSLDGGMQGAIDVIIKLLESKEPAVFTAALSNLAETIDNLAAVEEGRERLKSFRELLETHYARILDEASGQGQRAVLLIRYLRTFYTSPRAIAFSPEAVRKILVKALLKSSDAELVEALNVLFDIAFVPNLHWPSAPLRPATERMRNCPLEESLREYLWSDPTVLSTYQIDMSPVDIAKSAVVGALIAQEGHITEVDLELAIARAISPNGVSRPMMRLETPAPLNASNNAIAQ